MKSEVTVKTSTVEEILKFNWKWKIPNFDMKKHYRKQFKLNNGKIEMTIEMKPFTGKHFSRNEPVWMFTKVDESMISKRIKMSITSETDRTFHSKTSFKEICVDRNYQGDLVHYIRAHDIKHILDSDKVANFVIALTIVGKKKSNVSPEYLHFMTHDKIIDFNGISQLIGSKDFADFEFMIGDERVPAHKFMLAARSKICEEIFWGNDEKKEENFAFIEQVSKEIFMNFFAYLYTEKPIDFSQDKESYLKLFDKFGMAQLLNISCG